MPPLTSTSESVEGLLENTAGAVAVIIRFETLLREHAIRVLSGEARWWKTRVPGQVRENAEELRKKDRASPFAPRLKYHQIYYCYLEDLYQIISNKGNRSLFLNSSHVDLDSRFQELLALRNRAFHGRLLTQVEMQRVSTLTRELSSLLTLGNMPDSLSLEDPVALCLAAAHFMDDTLRVIQAHEAPSPPAALSELVSSACLLEQIGEDMLSDIEGVIELAQRLGALKGQRSARLKIAKLIDSHQTKAMLVRAAALKPYFMALANTQ